MTGSATMDLPGTSIPALIYGTAWKEGRTRALVEQAIAAGFRGIDTANQRKHYFEAAVGEALASVLKPGGIPRDQLFVQTKFTYQRGQDHRLPYDPKAPLATQVRQSMASSIEHLGIDAVDSYVLHGPEGFAWSAADDEVWKAMTELQGEGLTRFLGVSNVSITHLEALFAAHSSRPAFVQNRCYARTGWDRSVRDFCRHNGVVYQGFSLLTANPEVLLHPFVKDLAERHGRPVQTIVFRACQHMGMLPLTGTTDSVHMRDDLNCGSITLDEKSVRQIETLVA